LERKFFWGCATDSIPGGRRGEQLSFNCVGVQSGREEGRGEDGDVEMKGGVTGLAGNRRNE
jgi:hypothetical protein